MTFKVVKTGENNERKVLGTVWASEENQARVVASALWGTADDRLTIRKSEEDREIPFHLPH